MSTKEVENYPGMIESEGTWIVDAMREQAQVSQ
jgi:thioredoxin reductase